MKRELVCIVCPRGCRLTLDLTGPEPQVSGNSCPRGRDYALQEHLRPMRTVTTTVRVGNRPGVMLSVKTAFPVEKSRIFDITNMIHRTTVFAPVSMGQVILADVFGTDVVATAEIL